MEVLISWSGERSRRVAKALREWLPDVLQRIKPWMSEQDIYPGTRWADELGTRLAKINFGIVCVSPENKETPWILFEAGALAKSLDFGRVVPVLVEITSADLDGPLAQFQSVETNEDGVKSLLLSLNRALPDEFKMTDERVEKVFGRWWPELKERFSQNPVGAPEASPKPTRSDRQLLEEILEISRRLGGVGEFKKRPTVSEMLATLRDARATLDRKESSLSAAEYNFERGGVEVPTGLQESLKQTWEEIRKYDAALQALDAIKSAELRKLL